MRQPFNNKEHFRGTKQPNRSYARLDEQRRLPGEWHPGRTEMGYRLEWRLVGLGNRLLDSGEIDNGFPDHQTALHALEAFRGGFLLGAATTMRMAGGSRSGDSDLKVLINLAQ